MLWVNILCVSVGFGWVFGNLSTEEEIAIDRFQEFVQVQTQNGVLQGKLKILENGQSYYSFLGIPYAQPPVGNLRFRDPVPYKKWTGVLNATQFGPGCVEVTLRQVSYSVFGQEDCLYLNVFTPKNPEVSKELLPVMFWIYGGSFREGSALFYGPDYLMKEEVVVVTFNYRLGFFGFLSTQDQSAPGNYGIKDIVLALRWVKQNIIKFGGNPQNITIFGESAGGAIVGYLLLAAQTKGLYHAAIMSSGTPLCPWGFHRNARKVAFDLGLAMGITTNCSAKLVNYLRNVDLPNAHQAMIRVNILNFLEVFDNGGPFGPVLEEPGSSAIITKDSYRAFKNGDFNRVPVLMGVNSQESKFFNSLLPVMRPGLFLYDISPSSIARTSMNVKSKKDKRTIGSKVREYYFSSGSFLGGSDIEYAEFFSDDLFVRPITKTAQFLSRYVPVYFYVFDFEGNMGQAWLNYAASYNKFVKGVAHGTDLWYLWKSGWYHHNLKTPNEQLTSERLVKLWTNFATFKNPTPHLIEAIEVKWPKVKSPNVDYYHIAKTIRVRRNFKEASLQFWDRLYSNYSNGPIQTY